MIPTLTRAGDGRPAAPVRILHLGLGGFFRAHQAWYTEHSPDAAQWGIAAFTGRSTRTADRLNAQDGMYTLVTRGPAGDRFERIGSVSAAHPGRDHPAWLRYWRDPRLAVVTLTVTEAGYTRTPDGALDTGLPDVRADIATLRAAPGAPVATAAARLLAGLFARRRAGGGPVAIVPCDNLPGNGRTVARIVRELADAIGPSWARAAHASYVDTVADRITPWPPDETTAVVAAATGRTDAAPVVTEPFTEWVLCGDFPAGRPHWEDVGARFVPDITPYERRKLRLLNGGHSLLAYAGSLRGHTTVAEAVSDPLCRTWLTEWWDEASAGPDPDPGLAAYRTALLERFSNPRIAHALTKIAENGADKLLGRVVPTLRTGGRSGATPVAAIRIIAAWLLYLRDDITRPVSGSLRDDARSVLHRLDPALALDPDLVDAVALQADELPLK